MHDELVGCYRSREAGAVTHYLYRRFKGYSMETADGFSTRLWRDSVEDALREFFRTTNFEEVPFPSKVEHDGVIEEEE